MDKKAMYNISYGLFVLTAFEAGKDNGCITNTLAQVTTAPNRVSVAVNKANLTHDMILRTGKFTASIISEDADFELFKHFGFQSGRDVDKFAGFEGTKLGDNGTMIITKGTNAFISASVVQSIDLGTHTMFIADVTDAEVLSDAPSATYAYYQAHIKPAPKPRAAAVSDAGAGTGTGDGATSGAGTGADAASGAGAEPRKTIWRCTVCGYEYEGEELPEDFICPWCKHPASDFEKVEG